MPERSLVLAGCSLTAAMRPRPAAARRLLPRQDDPPDRAARTSAAATIPTRRTFATYLRKHIPGEPDDLVQNMPGGGGLAVANWLFNVAPKDGLTIGLIQRGVPFYPFFGDKNALFVPTQFNWLGSFNSETGVDHDLAHRQGADAGGRASRRRRVLGGSGPNDSETYPSLMNNTIGTKFRVVSRLQANTRGLLAMERGEVEGVTGSWSSLKAERPNWLRDKQVNVIVQFARTRHPDLPDVPLIMDFVKTDEDKAMWNVILAMARSAVRSRRRREFRRS